MAGEMAVDLVVISIHHPEESSRWIFGSDAERIINFLRTRLWTGSRTGEELVRRQFPISRALADQSPPRRSFG